MEKTDKPLTRFDQIKSCETPEDMVVILNGNELRFCPKGYKAKPVHCEEPCGRCISNWLKEPTRPRFSPEEVAKAAHLHGAWGENARLRRTSSNTLTLEQGEGLWLLPNEWFPSLRPGQAVKLEDVVGGTP